MIFLDGVGIGRRDGTVNPFFASEYPSLSSMFGGVIPSVDNPAVLDTGFAIGKIDATLGVPGLPQSGTGQTALFTGVNAAAYIGKHFGPYPYSTLQPIIEEKNIFRRIRNAGRSFSFVNAYPKQFFDYIESGKRRLTVTTLACLLSRIPLHHADDLREKKAISADITNERWHALGYPDIGTIPPAEAGRRFAHLASRHDFLLFEYFLTDHAGHKQDMENAVRVIGVFDEFLGGFNDARDDGTLLVMTSDHGNVEDLTVKTHTRNDVPLWVSGTRSADFVDGLGSLTDISGRIMKRLHIDP
jgi:2,3-bisphosphoglycerate-independent phosphoglycerate mutase